MASTIIKFPDGRTKEGEKIVSAYREVNGTDYMIVDTEEYDNGNKVVGVSYKPVGEERFRNIVDLEEWKKTKELLVANLHNKKDGYDYLVLGDETLVTEDYKHNLALRKENLSQLEANYETFLNSRNASTPNIAPIVVTPEPIPVPNQEIASDTINEVVSEPTIEPTKISVETPVIEPTVAPSVEPTPVIAEEPVNNIFTTNPDVNNTAPVQPQVMNNNSGGAESNNQANSSTVAKYYEDTINSLVSELKDVTDKYKELTDKMFNTVEEIGGKLVNFCNEINARDELSRQTFEKSQQILASQNNDDITRDLTKVA